MSSLVRIPTRFFEDHYSRDLPTPEIVRQTKAHYWIDRADPALPELICDAKHYADRYGPDCGANLKPSAIALLRALGEV